MERLFDGRNRRVHIQQSAIAMCARDGETICVGEGDHLLVILFSWAEPLSELVWCQILMIKGAARIIKLLKKVRQLSSFRRGSAIAKSKRFVAGTFSPRCPLDTALGTWPWRIFRGAAWVEEKLSKNAKQ